MILFNNEFLSPYSWIAFLTSLVYVATLMIPKTRALFFVVFFVAFMSHIQNYRANNVTLSLFYALILLFNYIISYAPSFILKKSKLRDMVLRDAFNTLFPNSELVDIVMVSLNRILDGNSLQNVLNQMPPVNPAPAHPAA